MKKFSYLLILVLLCNPVFAYPLKAGVVYTVEAVRCLAFEGIKKSIDISKYAPYLKDYDFEDNKKAVAKKKFNFRNKKIQIFSDGSYSVLLKKAPNPYFIYNSKGKLEVIIFCVDTNNYPKKSISYDINGNFRSVAYQINKQEQYVFDTNKKLIAHWIGHNCYNENGILIMTRNEEY